MSYIPKSTNAERQNLMISDLMSIDTQTLIGTAMRRHKQKEQAGKGIPVMLEAIAKDSSFIGTIASGQKGDSKKIFTIEEILNGLEEYAKEADTVMYSSYKRLAEKGTFVFRIGRFVGQNFTSVSPQKIPVTHSLFTMNGSDLEPFGWMACEVIDEEQYNKLILQYESSSEKTITQIVERKKAFENKRQAELQLKREQKEQIDREIAVQKSKEEAEKARVESLSPVDRLLEEHGAVELIQMMQKGQIEDYDSIKLQLAEKLKVRLQENPKTWDNAKQKALKRKEFIQSILVP